MSLAFIDSLWQVGREQSDQDEDSITFERAVFINKDQVKDLDLITLPDYRALEDYFTYDEVGQCLYDPTNLILKFSYNHPNGLLDIAYFFYDSDPFTFIIELLGQRATRADLDANLSSKVVDDGDFGLFDPVIGKSHEESVIGESDLLLQSNGLPGEYNDDSGTVIFNDRYRDQDNFIEDYINDDLGIYPDVGGYAPTSDLPFLTQPDPERVDVSPDPRHYYYDLAPPGSRV